jgi:hypothetical protein
MKSSKNSEAFLQQAKETIASQTIDQNNPGTILKDFNAFLEHLKNGEIEVSGQNSLFPLKLLPELNSLLIKPTLTDLKRPVQKSYPYINGIYLLLRTTGLAIITQQGKKQKLILDEDVYQSWKQLNFTEQYLTLLEAWLIHANSETIGDPDYKSNLLTCIWFWQKLPHKLKITKNNQNHYNFGYSPQLHNLALLDLFGWIKLEQTKPETGKGWSIKQIEKTRYGETLIKLLTYSLSNQESDDFADMSYLWDILDEAKISKYGELQQYLQPYFPEWRNNLLVKEAKFREGLYLFKASLGKCWRLIAIPANLDLDCLADIILDAFEFDHDHLYKFSCKQKTGVTLDIYHSYLEHELVTEDFLVGDLPLQEGQNMTFLFDFGDNWEFDLTLQQIRPQDSKITQAEILQSHGQAPEQYPDYEDDY